MWQQAKTVFFLGGLFAVFLILGFLLGGVTGLTIGFIIAFIINLLAYWYSDKIVLYMYKAKEADEKEYESIYSAVREITQKANLPMPRVFVMDSDTPNAFATGRNPQKAVVAVTKGLLRILDKRELRGVIAHEVAHIKNRDILIGSIAAVVAGAISYIAMMARWGAIFGGGRDDGDGMLGVILMSIIAPVIAMIISFAISRSREYLADSTGAGFTKDPNALADALQKLNAANKSKPMKNANPATSHMFIVNPLSAKAVLTLFSTHPPANKRIGKLRSMSIR